jgi:hypothetical protein
MHLTWLIGMLLGSVLGQLHPNAGGIGDGVFGECCLASKFDSLLKVS